MTPPRHDDEASALLSEHCQTCVVAICGIPGAGKSTVAEGLKKVAGNFGIPCDVITMDDFTRNVGGETKVREGKDFALSIEAFDPHQYKVGRQVALQSLRQMLAQCPEETSSDGDVENASSRNHSYRLIVIDDTFHLKSMRAEVWRCARNAGSCFLIVHVKCTIEVALENNADRKCSGTNGDIVPDAILCKTAEQFESPSHSENSWQSNCIDYVKVSRDNIQISLPIVAKRSEQPIVYECNFQDLTLLGKENTREPFVLLWKAICRVWMAAPKPVRKSADDIIEEQNRKRLSRLLNAESLFHQADLSTRHSMKIAMESRPDIDKEARQTLAKVLNTERRRLLKRWKYTLQTDSSIRIDDIVESFELYCRKECSQE